MPRSSLYHARAALRSSAQKLMVASPRNIDAPLVGATVESRISAPQPFHHVRDGGDDDIRRRLMNHVPALRHASLLPGGSQMGELLLQLLPELFLLFDGPAFRAAVR